MKRFLQGIVCLTVTATAANSGQLAAQITNPPAVRVSADDDEMALLVPARPEREIQQDMEAARRMLETARTATQNLERRFQIVRGRIEVGKQESETVKARMDLADKEDRETEKATLQRDRETINQHVRLLERLRDVYESEKRYEESRSNFARSGITLYQAELELFSIRAEDSTAADRLMNSEFMDKQRQVLRAQQSRAESQQSMAQRHKDVFERKIRLLQSQVEWLARQT